MNNATSDSIMSISVQNSSNVPGTSAGTAHTDSSGDPFSASFGPGISTAGSLNQEQSTQSEVSGDFCPINSSMYQYIYSNECKVTAIFTGTEIGLHGNFF